MYHVDNPSAVPDMPPIDPVQSVDPKWFQNGGEGQAPTYPGQEWFNIVQAELLNVLVAAGLNPVKSDLTQLAQSINLMSYQKWTPVSANIEQLPASSYVFMAGAEIQLLENGNPFWAMVDFDVDLALMDCVIRAPAGKTIVTDNGEDDSVRIVVTGQPFLFYRVGTQWRVSQ
ncbi:MULTISPECIES: hypothetical protein [Aeromonas]|nr:hypothetical protein [Aeromonas schubertii]